MPNSNYIEIKVGDELLDLGNISELAISLNYKLEDPDDFQRKSSSQSYSIKVPASKHNSTIVNSFHNLGVEDNTRNQLYRSHVKGSIKLLGTELLSGKAFLINASKTLTPDSYEFSFYGNNADWIIDLKEKTLYDLVSHINFTLEKTGIIDSFEFDGRDENLPYVFAPVKYGGYMDNTLLTDSNVEVTYLKPSLSVYWLIYWAFKSVGYNINSEFFSTDYFRRAVMPWMWGSFLTSEGTKLDIHRFLAKGLNRAYIDYEYHDFVNLDVSNDSTDGGYDNNNDYHFESGPISTVNAGDAYGCMIWEYKVPDYGELIATLSVQLEYKISLVGSNSWASIVVNWYHFDSATSDWTRIAAEQVAMESGANLSNPQFFGTPTSFFSHLVKNGDKIMATVTLDLGIGKGIGARGNVTLNCLACQMEYFRIGLGGTIDFHNYTGFKKHKVVDFISGIADAFNLSFATDTVSKVVTIEPTHAYSLTSNPNRTMKGYFNGNVVEWESKRNRLESSIVSLFSDYEREVIFKFKDDQSDGIVKKLQDRNSTIFSAGKYVFPSRFKSGKKEYENRFFGPTAHYEAQQFKDITGVSPQFVCMVPENISNTSYKESENTFAPKLCYYKGEVAGVGGWKLDGEERNTFPYMFAVNYKPGGHDDPIFSYCDESIGEYIGQGLLKRFFWQRLAIMRNGQFYTCNLRLNNTDFSSYSHREHKIIEGQRLELVSIEDYKPLKDDTSKCTLRKHSPITEEDYNNTYPSKTSILGEGYGLEYDMRYQKALCLPSDLPIIRD